MKKKIFITGASKGIGLGIAKIFYQHDFEVGICARSEGPLNEASTLLPGIKTYQCDISRKKEIERLAQNIITDFGRLDVLVNNGGVFLPGKIHEEEDEVFEKQIHTNLFSAYYLTKAILPSMLEFKEGTIINMCSIASIMAYAAGGSYAISKFGLLGFSKSLREEMKPYNIRVVSILPGAVKTASWEGVDLPEERFIPVEDIAKITWNAYEMSDRTVIEEIVVRPALGDI